MNCECSDKMYIHVCIKNYLELKGLKKKKVHVEIHFWSVKLTDITT